MSYSVKGILASALFLFLNMIVFFVLLWKSFKAQNECICVLLMLFAASVGCIWGIDIVSAMPVREIYYFMLYPLLSVVLMCIYSEFKGILKKLLLLVLVCLFLVNIPRHILPLMDDIIHRDDDIAYEISDYLEENQYTVAFGLWDFGDEVAVASKGNLKMQFWKDEFTLSPYGTLRENEIYDDDTHKIIYLFYGDHSLDEGIQHASDLNVELTVQKHYTDKNIYLCTASDNLMKLYAELHKSPCSYE